MKFLEYKSMLSGWQVIRQLYPEATDAAWLAVGRLNYTDVRIRYANGKVVM